MNEVVADKKYEALLKEGSPFLKDIRALQEAFWLTNECPFGMEKFRDKGEDDRKHTERDLHFLDDLMALKLNADGNPEYPEGSREWVLNHIVVELHDVTKQWSPLEIAGILKNQGFKDEEILDAFQKELPHVAADLIAGKGGRPNKDPKLSGNYDNTALLLYHNRFGAIISRMLMEKYQKEGLFFDDNDIEYVLKMMNNHHFPPVFFVGTVDRLLAKGNVAEYGTRQAKLQQYIQAVNEYQKTDSSKSLQQPQISEYFDPEEVVVWQAVLPSLFSENEMPELNIIADALDMVNGYKIAWYGCRDGFANTFRESLASAAGSSIESVVLPFMYPEYIAYAENTYNNMSGALSSFYSPEDQASIQTELNTIMLSAKDLASEIKNFPNPNFYLFFNKFQDLRTRIGQIFMKFPLQENFVEKAREQGIPVQGNDINLKPRDAAGELDKEERQKAVDFVQVFIDNAYEQ